MHRVALQGRELGPVGPHALGGDEQTRIIDRLKGELDPPFIDGLALGGRAPPAGERGNTAFVDAMFFFGLGRRRDDPEAGPYRVRLRVLRGVPGVKRVGEGMQLVVPGVDGSVGERQSGQPRIGGAGFR